MPETPTPIGVAVVEHRGRFLAGHRDASGPLGGYAEFPGGKCNAGESPGLCACRECLEETGLEVTVVDLLMRRTFTYPHGTVDLHFWLCRPVPRAEIKDDHKGYRWVAPEELKSLRFPEANQPLIDILSKRERDSTSPH